MAEPEIAALKRAYVDTLLNTSKEAAARMMVSEMKARRYQQEIVTVKDEAMNLLLRLKQMYDSKVKETEIISLQQQKKVEELEGQLGEAEDIVGELRMELQVLNDELRKITNGQTHLKSDDEEVSCWKNSEAAVSVVTEVSSNHKRSGAVDSSCIRVEQSGLAVANGIKISSLFRNNSIKRCSSTDNEGRCHHTLPSILKKRRFTEGCTHMIHMVDRSMANGNLSSSLEAGDDNDGVYLHKVTSCKSVENLEVSGCADGSDSTSCVFNDVGDGEDPTLSPNSSQKNSTPREYGNDRKMVIGETEKRKEAKESCESNEVSVSPLCEETPVLVVNKNQCIKYTFKRRKKEVLSNLEGESRNMKQKTGDKDDGYLESLKPSLTGESSQDSLCVARVAP